MFFIKSYRGIEFGNFEQFSTTLGGVSFVKFPIDEAFSADKTLAWLPCRSVERVALPFDQVYWLAFFCLSLCKNLDAS